GAKFELAVNSLAQAIRLLDANFPGQFVKLVEKDAFYIARGKKLGRHINYTEEMIRMNAPDGAHFHMIPSTMGGASSLATKKGLGSILLGVAIVGVSLFFGYTPGVVAGISMILGGASLLLTPDVSAKNEDKGKSYSF